MVTYLHKNKLCHEILTSNLKKKKIWKNFQSDASLYNMVAHTLYNISVHYYCNIADTLSIPSNSELKNSYIKKKISYHIFSKNVMKILADF